MELSKYTDRAFYASDGAVTIYENGKLVHKKPFRKYHKGARSDVGEIPINTKKGNGRGLNLGNNESNFKGIVTRNGVEIAEYERGLLLEIFRSKKLYGGNTIFLSKYKTTTVTGTLDDVNEILKTSKNADGSINGIVLLNEVQNIGGINILRSPKWGDILNKHTFTNETGKL